MTILDCGDHPQLQLELPVEEMKLGQSQEVFEAPDTNAFGQNFRDYTNAETERQKGVEEFYRLQHINQTYDYVKKMREIISKLDKTEMSIWECLELLNEVVDDSDPDLDEPQIQHLLQSAEAIRKDYPDQDWLPLTAQIHDLGKVLLCNAHIIPKFHPASAFESNDSVFGKSYLKNFGYLRNVRDGDSTDDRIYESAVISFQENYNISPTGILDADTMSVMRRPRCGVKDIVNGVNSMRRRPHSCDAYEIGGPCCFVLLPGCPKWPKFELSYVFDSSIPEVAKLPMELAFQQWSDATDFTFSEKLGDRPSDITIGMYRGDHGDKYPFRGQELAHAFGPPDGRLHFDADWPWFYGSHYGGGDEDKFIDFKTAALHEIGHILGLDHSLDEGAIMYPTINYGQIKRDLTPDDTDGILSLYGSTRE